MSKGVDGERIADISERTFGTRSPTVKQLMYIYQMMSPSSYALKNYPIRGVPITFSVSQRDSSQVFKHRPWQIDILNDKHPDKAVMKSRQLGLSELGIIELLHFADTHSYAHVKCMYTFPTNRQLDGFVSTRLNTVLSNEYFSQILDPDEDSLQKKKIRNSFIMFRSSSKGSAVEGTDIDFLSLDEYDRVNSVAEMSAMESLSSSPFKILRRWSTPTVPNHGIHDLFEKSDQHHYMHKCDSCGHRQVLDYEKNLECTDERGIDILAGTVRDGTYRFICSKCKAPLDRWYNGKWVPHYPSRTDGGRGTRGYFISQMNAVFVSADELKRKELRSKSKQSFYNYVLGFPYQDLALSILDDDILSRGREYLPEQIGTREDYRFISVGIDWGNTHWIVVRGMKDNGVIDIIGLKAISRSRGISNIEKDFQDVVAYIAPFNPDIILPDIGDSGNYVDMLAKRFPNRVYGVNVNSNPRSNGRINSTFSEPNSTVRIDKLTQNKLTIADIKMGRTGYYNENDQLKGLYIQHWKNVVIRDEEDDDTGATYQIITNKGDDHLAQSDVYSRVGMERLLEPFRDGDTANVFDYTSIETVLESTKPDIFGRGY